MGDDATRERSGLRKTTYLPHRGLPSSYLAGRIGLRMEQLEKSAPKFKAGSSGGRLKPHTRAGNRGLFHLAADSQRELAFRLCAQDAFYLEAKF